MAEVCLQFSTSTAWTSAIIRRLTQSPFSHVDIILPGEGLLGVSGPDRGIKDKGGVLIRPFDCWPYLCPPKVARVQCSEEQARRGIEWGRGEIGKPFDNAALYSFLRDRAGLPKLGRVWRDPSMWYCSEYGLRFWEVAKLFAYQLITPKDCVSPNTLLVHLNPYLTSENILEFL
jgi:hypothetical protein